MLTELGQKGGVLRLIAKIALLWGGIRGALSLTDKLISFLRMAEQPLFQRCNFIATLLFRIQGLIKVPSLIVLEQIPNPAN